MTTLSNEKLYKKTPCGNGENCNLCKSRSWCKLAAGNISGFQIEGLETDVAPIESDVREYKLAFDIGTTTIAGALVKEGKIIATTGFVNPQVAYGTDVLTRAQKSIQGAGDLLKSCIQEAIIAAAEELCVKYDILPKNVKSGVITGNTTMLYLLTGRNPKALTEAPFKADWLGDEEIEIGDIKYYLPPCVSAFIGADSVCAALASHMTESTATSILADMGTNGEILLWHNGKLTCCSTAAGPAFEGFGLSLGMPASNGAVEHVYSAGGRLVYKVIGGGEAKGICGSGIIDLVACLKQNGILQENGMLTDDHELINNSDVRMVQLAKSAVCAGIIAAAYHAGVSLGDIETLWLAGGFGKNINMQNAGAIGLFPFTLSGKAVAIGNGALKGAVMLCSGGVDKARKIASSAETLSLAENPVFQQQFLSGMAVKPVLT